jgi:hypothetical protein
MAKKREEELLDVYEYINKPVGERLIDAEKFENDNDEDSE